MEGLISGFKSIGIYPMFLIYFLNDHYKYKYLYNGFTT